MKKFAHTDTGPRKNNEDFFLLETFGELEVACIADGVGGNLCGEYASKFSVERFTELLQKSSSPNLENILKQVHLELIEQAAIRKECKGMATTFIGVQIQKNFVQFIHTGDSRLYLLRGNGLRQLTKDHTEVQRLKDEGLLNSETVNNYSRRNILDSALGVDKTLLTTYLSFECQPNDRLILSTDGFHDIFTKMELRDLSVNKTEFDSFTEALTSEMQLKTLVDNTTFIVIEID